MKGRRRSAQTPETILDAAEALIRREGAARLTLDAVAAEAGLSKGGVMHHFASRDALVAGMVAHQLARMDREVTAIEAGVAPSPAAPVVAMIRHARQHYGREDGIPKALLVAAAENPKALEGFRGKIAETLGRLGPAGGAPGEPAALLFAVLGLLLTESLGFYAYGAEEVAGMLDTLERMALDAGAKAGGPCG